MKEQITRIAQLTADYQEEGIHSDRVEAWLKQFDPKIQQAIAIETEHWIEKYYFSKSRTRVIIKSWFNFLEEACIQLNARRGKKFNFPHDFYFLDIQHHNSSQRAMLDIASEILDAEHGCSAYDCNGRAQVYIDDFTLTGNNMYNLSIKMHDSVLIFHMVAANNINKKVTTELNRNIDSWKAKAFVSLDMKKDCFMPQKPQSNIGEKYMQLIENHYSTEIKLREETVVNDNYFKQPENRNAIEQEFLEKGLHLTQGYNRSTHISEDFSLPLNEHGDVSLARPMGFDDQASLGHGVFLASFRNIPDHCPLVFWSNEGSWTPLFNATHFRDS